MRTKRASPTQTSPSSAATAPPHSRPSAPFRTLSSSDSGSLTRVSWPDAAWELDFRVGGREVHSGGSPGGSHHRFESRFHDIVEDQRIVFAYDLLLDHQLVSLSLTTIELFAAGDGTRLVFTEQGAFFDDLEDPAEREHGTGKLLDALERFLAGERVR